MVRGNDKRYREKSQTEYFAAAIQIACVGWGFPGRQEVSREQKLRVCLECGVGGTRRGKWCWSVRNDITACLLRHGKVFSSYWNPIQALVSLSFEVLIKVDTRVFQSLENYERDGNTRPPDLPPEKSVCRSGSNS